MIRGVGDNLGSGADLPEFMEAATTPTDCACAELRLEDEGVGDVTYPPKRNVPARRHDQRSGIADARAGNRPLQELKKISIVEAKGYCYGWHFYQCADADLRDLVRRRALRPPVVPLHGWGPRMWTVGADDGAAQVPGDGLHRAAVHAPTRWPSAASSTSVVPRDQLEAEVDKYARACADNRPSTPSSCRRRSSRSCKQHQGEYMGSLLSRVLRVDGQRRRASDGARRPGHDEAIDSGLADAVNDNDSKFPPDFRLSKSEPQEERT